MPRLKTCGGIHGYRRHRQAATGLDNIFFIRFRTGRCAGVRSMKKGRRENQNGCGFAVLF